MTAGASTSQIGQYVVSTAVMVGWLWLNLTASAIMYMAATVAAVTPIAQKNLDQKIDGGEKTWSSGKWTAVETSTPSHLQKRSLGVSCASTGKIKYSGS